MKKLLITEIKTETINDPKPYVVYRKHEEMPELIPCLGSEPMNLTVDQHILYPATFVNHKGEELNLCMTPEAQESLGLPLEVIDRLKRNVDDLESRIRGYQMAVKRKDKEFNRLRDLRWWQRLWPVFIGLNITEERK